MSRRKFLKMLGAGVALSAVPCSMFELSQADALAANDGILLIIYMGGGNDGLNTVVPINNGKYHDLRKSVGLDAKDVLPITTGYGLHPSLKTMKSLYDKGKVAIIQGVDYDKPDLSHFQSMAYWMGGWAPGGAPRSGWLGRYLDSLDSKSLLSGVSIGPGVPLHMLGTKGRTSAFPTDKWQLFGVPPEWQKPTDSEDARLYKGLRAMSVARTGRGALADHVSVTGARAIDVANRVSSCYPEKYEWQQGQLAQHMKIAANIINANLVRSISVGQWGYDTHTGQDWQQEKLLTELDNGIAAFYATLKPAMAKRVSILTFSEFGRRPEDNGSGTDHGTANSMFLIGDNVAGGFIGEAPSLTVLDKSGNLKPTTSVYSVYSTVVEKWLGADGKEVVGKAFTPLPLFKKGPG